MGSVEIPMHSPPPGIGMTDAPSRGLGGSMGRGARPLSLRRNFSWTLFGYVIYSASNWLMLTALAKLGTPQVVGQYALGLAFAQPIMMFAQLNLRSVQATDARRQYRFGDYLALRLIMTAAALVVITVLATRGGYPRETPLVILVVGLTLGLDSISDVFHGLFQQHERMDLVAISLAIRGPLALASLTAGMWLTGHLASAAAGPALASALVLLGYDAVNGLLILGNSPLATAAGPLLAGGHPEPAEGPRRGWRPLAGLVWLALPMGVAMMFNTLVSNIPRYFIEHYLGERELGIFAAVASVAGVGRMVSSALGQSASPRLARLHAAGDLRAFRILLAKLVAFGALLGGTVLLAGVIAGREILTLLYTPEYARRIDVLLWLLAVGGLYYVAGWLGVGLTAARQFKIQVPLTASVVGVAALLNWWLVPLDGLRGAAVSAFLSMAASAAISLMIAIRLFRIAEDK
jgi:O-antigen/teichoic acid export membrane protein